MVPSAPLLVLSRPVLVDDIPDDGLRVAVTATAAERVGLAELNGIVEVSSLAVSFLLRREARGGIWVTGEVSAAIVQTCVVTLEPFDGTVREQVDVHYLPEAALEAYRARQAKRVPDPSNTEEDEDEPDPILEGRIDVGALAAEALTLGLDPYPKKPGVRFEDLAPRDDASPPSPFAVLKALRTGEDA